MVAVINKLLLWRGPLAVQLLTQDTAKVCAQTQIYVAKMQNDVGTRHNLVADQFWEVFSSGLCLSAAAMESTAVSS